MKKLFSLALACLLLFSLSACGREPKEEVSDEKPVIYLYPEQETDVRVTLDLAGELTCAYPAYGDGWSVRAAPDGTLTDEDGQTSLSLLGGHVGDGLRLFDRLLRRGRGYRGVPRGCARAARP